MERGYIKLFRAIMDNPHWEEKPFNPAIAWIDMLLLANYKDTIYRKRGNRIDVLRGQLAWSMKGLADRWGWSQGRVKRFLDELTDGEQIEYQSGNLTTLITIINYEKYQGDGEQTDEQAVSKQGADGDQTVSRRRHLKKDKKVNKGKKEEATPVSFTSYFPTDWQEHEKFVEWSDKWDELRKKKRWPRDKVTYEAQAEKMLEYDIDTAIRALRNSIQSAWQGVFPKPERQINGATKGETPEHSADILRRLHSDISDATQELGNANNELQFTPKHTSADRVKKAELKLAELKAKLEG